MHTKQISFVLVVHFFNVTIFGYNPMNVTITPVWKKLETKHFSVLPEHIVWIIAGTIHLCKKTALPTAINTISFKWQGKPMDNLFGTLYKSTPTKELVPIEEYFLGDSSWNKNEQTLIFTLERPCTIHDDLLLYIMLSVSNPLEPILKKGNFTCMIKNIPSIYENNNSAPSLTLAYNQL